MLRPIHVDAFKIIRTALEVRNIREVKGNRERMHILGDELNQQVKTTLATVQSIVPQSHDEQPEVQKAVEARTCETHRSRD